MISDRYLKKSIEEDLNRKLAFLGSPRQMVATTLAKKIMANTNLSQSLVLIWRKETSHLKVTLTVADSRMPSLGKSCTLTRARFFVRGKRQIL